MKTDRNMSAVGKRVTAIEIGADCVKAAQVDRHGRSSSVSRVAIRRFDESDASGSAAVKAIKALGVEAGDVILCVPRQTVTVRTFELPSADPREVGDMIDLQIAKQTPYSRDEIVFGYRLAQGTRDGYTRVVLVIASSSVMRQKCRVVEDAGLGIRAVAASMDGLAGIVSQRVAGAGMAHGGGTAVLDIDAASAELVVMQDDAVLFSRGLPVGARDVTVDPVTGGERLIQEAARAVEAFRHEFSAGRIDRMLLTGALRGLADMPDRLRAILGIAVECHDVLADAKSGVATARDDETQGGQVSVSAVVGVALFPGHVEIDLTPDSILMRRAVTRRASEISRAAVLAVTVLVLLSLWIETRLYARQHYLTRLDELAKSTTTTADEIESMKRKVALVNVRMRSGQVAVGALAEACALVGPDTSLTAVEFAEGRLTLRGVNAGGPEVSGKLVGALENSPHFREAKRTRTVSAMDRTEFEVTCEVEGRHP